MSDYITFDIPSLNTRGRVKDGMLQIEQPLNEMNWHQPRPIEPGENIRRGWAWVYVKTDSGKHIPVNLDELDKYYFDIDSYKLMLGVYQNYLDAKRGQHPVNLF